MHIFEKMTFFFFKKSIPLVYLYGNVTPKNTDFEWILLLSSSQNIKQKMPGANSHPGVLYECLRKETSFAG